MYGIEFVIARAFVFRLSPRKRGPRQKSNTQRLWPLGSRLRGNERNL